ncbi:hypothetical protein EPN90_04805 [Patescibacteria group bacterium]|nr:MAG: hypothetical protein EPN90_04805 [Patescibacteria group bacterium]
MGNDPRAVLVALLDELGVKHFRLTIPWDRLEANRGQFTFAEIEWQLDEIKKRGGDAILAIGRRTPRWPECHDPAWLKAISPAEQDAATLNLIKTEVEKLKERREIIAWQVENEPLLRVFGRCERHSRKLWQSEVALARQLDGSRPVVTTESGELSTWFGTAPSVDALGISIYHQTWNNWLGKIIYPLSPAFYRRRTEFTRALFNKPVFVSELQAEPWAGAALTELSIDDQLRLEDAPSLRRMADFAASTRLSPVYFWGAEWWYTLREQGQPDVWETAKEIFKNRS